ncbi:phospholipase B1, membrane-associated-like [Tupaia chinensis]|uniref:phospholipase B1, membrane-associated-like n=1 Tax=Tupaia chinensis TaxID=246437 RepID=UPI000704431C|nr:phospholipase B1, membrane-associated-like [Tupaia chinensis]
MGLQLSIFLLGLLLPLGRGTTQIYTSSGKSVLKEQLWPELQTLKNFSFLCNTKKSGLKRPSKSAHSLRPSDIKFVAAIINLETPPDSGMADPKEQKPTDKRPQQVCMGVMTVLADIIRHFSPSVLTPVCPSGKESVPPSDAKNLWLQAKELVRRMKENPQLDFLYDWKLITVFFSNASRCYLCSSAQLKSHVEDNLDQLSQLLDHLHEKVPKAFVNLVDLSEVARVTHWHQGAQLR